MNLFFIFFIFPNLAQHFSLFMPHHQAWKIYIIEEQEEKLIIFLKSQLFFNQLEGKFHFCDWHYTKSRQIAHKKLQNLSHKLIAFNIMSREHRKISSSSSLSFANEIRAATSRSQKWNCLFNQQPPSCILKPWIISH